ncbi:hypothetical protein D3C72_2391200 [compost metagenome]
MGHFFDTLKQGRDRVEIKVLGIAGGPGIHAATELAVVLEAFLENLIALGSGGRDLLQAELSEQCTVDVDAQAFGLGL